MDPADREVKEKTTHEREIYAERAETEPQEITEEEMQTLALAYAKYLAEHNIKPGEATFIEPEELMSAESDAEAEPDTEADAVEDTDADVQEEAVVTEEVQAQSDEVEQPQADEPQITEEIAQEETMPEDTEEKTPEERPSEEKAPEKKAKKPAGKKTPLFNREELSDEEAAKLAARLERSAAKAGPAAALVNLHDRIQTGMDATAGRLGKDFIRESHKIASSYRQSRRTIGTAMLIIGIVVAVVLAIFDKYTVYEYAYNGKILGYVNNQEDVTGVLEIAGEKLSENSSHGAEIKFVTNQNVTFNLVDGRGKSLDDSDTAINKLVYLTDIETEAYGIYDGKNLAAVVKSSEDAERLLEQSMAVLSEPDTGMKVVSSEFTNELAIQPINVLLTSVQSNSDALEMMTEGGSTQYYHIVETGESIGSLARTFGVDPINIYDENNENVITEIEQGDKVCIHKDNDPVSVQMVEKGKLREVIEFETIKQDSDEYYEGDTHVEQEGRDQIQVFTGTITKVGGEVTDRDEESTEIIRKGRDKIILIGTAERPRTAPTGTYLVPLEHYTLTSNFGPRWGRLHSGIDMAIRTGTPFMATDGGTVIRASWYSGYGNCIDVDHGNGRVTRYGHCSAIYVNVGDEVYQGQVIGLVGSTGNSTGPHLHFEIILNGTPVNPRPYLGI
ncbi:MAG: peptidoglycan DD-metalloendopeptidase family protein [Mogibacterium sp.]|nr:peptidoglycan DD-metalloendopeptidase family protein [Mogibacterium sp.]